MQALIRYLEKLILRVCLLPLRILKVRNNRVLLFNDLSRKFGDNPKAVARYLLENYPNKFDIIYAVGDVKQARKYIAHNLRFVKYKSIKYFYYAMTSAVFLTNSGGFSFIPLRKNQYVINTFHGGGAYKKCGIHMFNDSWAFRRDLKLSADNTNVFLSTCKRFSDVMSESNLIPRDIFLEVGMPRNDCLINHDMRRREEIRTSLKLLPEEKLVLFAPTYRKPNDNYFLKSIAIPYGIECKRVLQALEGRFGGKWKLAIRLHPTVVNKSDFDFGEIMNLSEYDDMKDLLLAADVLINDFSSSMWDFMLSGKPVFIFAKDFDHYINATEVYTPVEDWPFPIAKSNDELVNNIVSFDEVEYNEKCRRHYDSLGGCETGKATEIVSKLIYNKCLCNKL